jgi:hypothetical protein
VAPPCAAVGLTRRLRETAVFTFSSSKSERWRAIVAPVSWARTCSDVKPSCSTNRGRAVACETSIGEQKRGNIHVRDGVDEAAFVQLREARDATLAMPALILPAVQVNIRAGALPEPEGNGVRYLKLPVDTL